MKRIYSLFFCTAMLVANAQVPDWAWTRGAGSGDNDEATSIDADAAGNVYMTGFFSGASLALGSTTLSNSSAGTKNFFVVKYNRAGIVQWAKGAGGADDDEGSSIAVDAGGNVYVCGNYASTSITFGSAALTNSSNPGQTDMFLVKYSPTGTVLWSHSFGGSLQEDANAIAVDGSGNLCMTGNFFSLSVLFGNYGVINSGVSDAFVAKFNSSGVAQWAKRIGGGQTDNGNDVGIDNAGNVYVTGDYNSTTVPTFSPALSNSGGFDVYFSKFDASGTIIYGHRFGGSGDENATALHAQTGGNFFICGYFESPSLSFGSTTLSNSGTRSMYIARFTSAGAAQWAQKAAGSQNSIPRQLAEGGSSIYMTGSFDLSTLVFGSTTLNNGGSLDGFVVNYDASNGSVLWAKGTGSQGLEQSQAIAIGGGYVHIAGLFTSTLVLRDNFLIALGSTDAFVTKLCFAPAAPVSASGNTVCPGSQVTLNATTPAGTSPVWFSSATGGTSVHAGASYNAAAGSTFYVASKDTNSGCGMYSAARIAASGALHPPVNPVVSIAGHTLSATGNGSVTAWYDCTASATVSGQSGPTYVLTSSGHFAAIMVSAQGCRDTSTCNHYSYTPGTDTVVVTPGLVERAGRSLLLSAYPNPSTGSFRIESNYNTRCDLVNSLGMTLQRLALDDRNERTAVIGPLPPGVYFLVTESSRSLQRLIVSP